MKTTGQYGKKADLALGVWVKLARTFNVFHKRADEHIRTFGLTMPQFGVLEALGHLGAMTTGDLCKKLLVSGGNMTVVVNNLEKEKLVYRTQSEGDRRVITLDLTDKGKKLFGKIFPEHAAHIAALTASLTISEQQTLSGLLKKLGTALSEGNPQED